VLYNIMKKGKTDYVTKTANSIVVFRVSSCLRFSFPSKVSRTSQIVIFGLSVENSGAIILFLTSILDLDLIIFHLRILPSGHC